MTTVFLSPGPPLQQFNQGGSPLAGGKLFTYASNTTTKLATFTDYTGATANTNPVILDANGQCQVWLQEGYTYTYVLSPPTDTDPPTDAYWTVNGITGGSGGGGGVPVGFSIGLSGLTATGTTQATALPIAALINVYNTVPAASGAILPLGYSSNFPIVVMNRGAHVDLVYPGIGDQIEGYGVDTPVGVAPGGDASFYCFDFAGASQPRTWWLG